MARERRHRDADEEALQAALQESMQPDFLAQILEAEATPAMTVRSPTSSVSSDPRVRTASADERPLPPKIRSASTAVDDDDDDDVADLVEKPSPVDSHEGTDNESDDEDDNEANAHHALLNLADFLLLDVLYFLDEDSVVLCMAACKRLRHVAKSEALFESLCRRIFPLQCPRVALAAATNRFALRKFSSWFHMLQERPRVRHNGFYYLKTFYYKKPELNMWTTDIAPGTILQVVYYRYFSFQRDGTVLYAMIFKPPHEAGAVLKRLTKDVYIGSFQVDKHEVFVSVPTSHNVVEFKFRISAGKATRGKNAKLVLQEHCAFSEPDRSGWVDYFDTAEEEFPFYRQWDL